MKLHSLSYPVYKETYHNEWVSQLPEEWEEKRVKDLFRLITDLAPKDNDFELLSLYTALGVKPRKDMEQRGNKSVTTEDYWIVKKGDIIVNKLLAWMGAVGLSDYDGVTSPAYDILRRKRKNKQEVDERFYTYLFRTEKAKEIFRRHSRGIMEVRLRLYFDKFGALTIPAPSFAIQKAIADYLDAKTAQIDRKIELLEGKAEKYADLKQSLINETVGRGLDKTVPMKDSGVEWIGQIPAHWETVSIKRLAKNQQNIVQTGPFGAQLHASDYVESGVPLILIKNVSNLFIDDTDIPKVTEEKANQLEMYRLKIDDIVFSRVGSIGRIALITKREAGWLISGQMLRLRIKNSNLSKKYLIYAFSSDYVSEYISTRSLGSTRDSINTDILRECVLLVPLFEEQKAIADYLETKTAHIEKIIETINLEVEKLKELRKTLINDVVTGKIKVYEG